MIFNNPIRKYFMADPPGGGAGPSNDDVSNTNELNKSLTETEELVVEIKNTFRGIGAELTEIVNDKMKKLKGESKNIALGVKKDIVGSLKEQSKETSRILALQDKQKNGSIKISEVEERQSKAKEKQRNIALSLEEAVREGIISQETANTKLEQANEQYNKQKELLDQLGKKAEEFERKLGLTYKIFQGINKIPILNALVDVQKVQKKMEEAAGEGKSAWGVFGTGIKETFSQIGKSLQDPLTIVTGIASMFAYLVKMALEFDKQTTEFAKNIGLTKEGTKVIEQNFIAMNSNADKFSKNLQYGALSVSALEKATNDLNSSLGTAELFTGKMLAGQILLTQRLGFSNEEAAEFSKFTLLTGKYQEDITKEIGDQVVAFRKETGVQLDFRKVMKDITKIHGQLSANLGNDPKKIAAAVMEAKKLGLTLEQTRNMSNSLLNFEQSISDELEAELLTGKSLNLERARALALQGKTTEAAAELMNQVGGLSDFQKMNVLQQSAIAKTIGLTADELADAYKEQELLKGTAFQTKEAFLEQYKLAEQQGTLAQFQAEVKRAANGEELLQMGARQSIQDKFNETILSLKDTLNRILSGPMLGMLEKFTNFISKAENIRSIFKGVSNILGTIQGIFNVIVTIIGVRMVAALAKTVLQLAAAAVEAGVLATESATTASAATLGIGAVAIVAGLVAIMAGMNSAINDAQSAAEGAATSIKDGAINPSGGLVISGPKGSFLSDKDDDVVAAPGLIENMKLASSRKAAPPAESAAPAAGNNQVYALSKADIDAIANRPINVVVKANTDTIMSLSTAQSQFGAPSLFA